MAGVLLLVVGCWWLVVGGWWLVVGCFFVVVVTIVVRQGTTFGYLSESHGYNRRLSAR